MDHVLAVHVTKSKKLSTRQQKMLTKLFIGTAELIDEWGGITKIQTEHQGRTFLNALLNLQMNTLPK